MDSQLGRHFHFTYYRLLDLLREIQERLSRIHLSSFREEAHTLSLGLSFFSSASV
jgi:hypothetical protein